MARRRRTAEKSIAGLREGRILIEGWPREYNAVRPHSALGYRLSASTAISLETLA